MSKQKHTPGPWKTQPHISLDRLEIRDADGRRIAECAMDFPMSAKTHDANARLIAAAPELLEAAEHAWTFVSDILETGMSQSEEVRALERALKDAIAKAKGGEE